jgi:hypothetical protein
MLFAIAYVYDDLPRHDRVERDGNHLKYYDKGVEVYTEFVPNWIITRRPRLGLAFIKAESASEAHHKFRESFPLNITAVTVAKIPKNP